MSKSNVKQRVKELLQHNVSWADNDNELIYTYWSFFSDNEDSRPFSKWFIENPKLCNHISRSRRKIEEQCPELRGKGYNKRHHILEPEFREKVKNNEL